MMMKRGYNLSYVTHLAKAFAKAAPIKTCGNGVSSMIYGTNSIPFLDGVVGDPECS